MGLCVVVGSVPSPPGSAVNGCRPRLRPRQTTSCSRCASRWRPGIGEAYDAIRRPAKQDARGTRWLGPASGPVRPFVLRGGIVLVTLVERHRPQQQEYDGRNRRHVRSYLRYGGDPGGAAVQSWQEVGESGIEDDGNQNMDPPRGTSSLSFLHRVLSVKVGRRRLQGRPRNIGQSYPFERSLATVPPLYTVSPTEDAEGGECLGLPTCRTRGQAGRLHRRRRRFPGGV